MKIEFLDVADAIETKQEFILSETLPFPKNTLGMISAKGGCGKTSLSLILSSEYVNNHIGNVALWLTEDDNGNVKHRINLLLENKVMSDFNQNRVKLINSSPIHLSKNKDREFVNDEESFNELRLFCLENDIRLLIIDPLLAFFGGNENDNSQARTFMQPFINWCKEDDINIIFIHHSSKGEISNTRGAGAFSDAVRCAYVLSMPLIEQDKKIVEDKELMAMGMRVIHCTKDNRGAIQEIYKYQKSNPFELQVVQSFSDEIINGLTMTKEDFAIFTQNCIKKAKDEPIVTEYEVDMPNVLD